MPRRDPAAQAEYMRAYYRANRERLIERAKEWNAGHPERRVEARRKWYAAHGAEHREANRERLQAAQARYYARHPEQKAIGNRTQVLRRYGLTHAQYDEMLTAQGGVCAICRKPETHRGRNGEVSRMPVDHDHVTGSVRALLCHSCNTGLGSFYDDPELLEAAAGYVMRWRT